MALAGIGGIQTVRMEVFSSCIYNFSLKKKQCRMKELLDNKIIMCYRIFCMLKYFVIIAS